jgi:predicted Zn-dependent protease
MDELGDRVLPADSPEVVRVQHVAGRLVRASQNPKLQQEINLRVRGYVFEWEANVVRDRQVNAFSLPAGKLFVYTGLLRVTGPDDDYLATVLSHEIAHALAHHASERVAREQSGAGILRQLRYNREQEEEADHIGVFLMPFAGYDPRKAVTFWQRMQQAQGGRGVPELLSDHPSDRHRIEKMRRWVPPALGAKRAFDEGRVTPGP